MFRFRCRYKDGIMDPLEDSRKICVHLISSTKKLSKGLVRSGRRESLVKEISRSINNGCLPGSTGRLVLMLLGGVGSRTDRCTCVCLHDESTQKKFCERTFNAAAAAAAGMAAAPVIGRRRPSWRGVPLCSVRWLLGLWLENRGAMCSMRCSAVGATW